MYIINKQIYIYIQKHYLPRPTFWVVDRSLTSLFSQLILSLVATLQLGMALKDDVHTHTFIYIYMCVCAVYMSGCCIVTFAGHWSSTMYKVCTALWPNARFEYVFHFFTLDWCNMSPQPCNMFACLVFKMCLKKLLLGSYWVQDSSRTVSFPKVASFLEQYCTCWRSL